MMRALAMVIAVSGCVDLGLDPEDFAEKTPPEALPDAGEIAKTDDDSGVPDPIEENDAATEDDAAELDAAATSADAGAIEDAGQNDAGASACNTGPNGTWTQLSVSGAVPRAGHTAMVDTVRNRALIYGGAGAEARLFELSVSGTPEFQPINTNTPPPVRREHGAVYGPDGIVIFGGIGADGAARDDTWSLIFNANPQWTEQEPLSTPRYSVAGAIIDSIVPYVGLFSGCGDQGPFGDDHQFDVLLALITELTSPAPKPSARCDQSATFVQGWGTAIFGGHDTAALSDLWLLVENFPNRSWTLISQEGPARSGHSTVLDAARRRLLVFGGVDETGAKSNDVWAYSIDANCWSELAPNGTAPSPRSQHAAFILDGVMYVVAGDDGTTRDDLWSLTF